MVHIAAIISITIQGGQFITSSFFLINLYPITVAQIKEGFSFINTLPSGSKKMYLLISGLLDESFIFFRAKIEINTDLLKRYLFFN
jgi:hypothetical protein